MIDVQRTDFVAVPTQDVARAAQFYGETLGLTRNPNSTESWIEFETGNTTLALVSPESIGAPFAPLPVGSVVFRVPDFQAVHAELGAREIICDYRPDAGLRFGPHFFTTDDEIRFAVEQVGEILESGAHLARLGATAGF